MHKNVNLSSTSFEQNRAFWVLENRIKTHKIDLIDIETCGSFLPQEHLSYGKDCVPAGQMEN